MDAKYLCEWCRDNRTYCTRCGREDIACWCEYGHPDTPHANIAAEEWYNRGQCAACAGHLQDTATPRPWHVWIATATDGVGREPIATHPTWADAYSWAEDKWTPDMGNDAAYIIAQTHADADNIARDLYGN